MIEKKIYSWFGLCMRSRNLVSGEDTTLREVKKSKVCLVIIAEDASDNTKKLFRDKCSYRNIEFHYFGKKEMIGKSIGKSPRSVIGIVDKNMANQIVNLLSES